MSTVFHDAQIMDQVRLMTALHAKIMGRIMMKHGTPVSHSDAAQWVSELGSTGRYRIGAIWFLPDAGGKPENHGYRLEFVPSRTSGMAQLPDIFRAEFWGPTWGTALKRGLIEWAEFEPEIWASLHPALLPDGRP
jgi:hypothetical protein